MLERQVAFVEISESGKRLSGPVLQLLKSLKSCLVDGEVPKDQSSARTERDHVMDFALAGVTDWFECSYRKELGRCSH
jgi:hypothetical protein